MGNDSQHLTADTAWVDQDVQQVRPYVIAGDRTQPSHMMRLDSVLTATPSGDLGAGTLQPEAAHAVQLCRERDRSVAEIAATIRQPVLVTKVILSDLLAAGALTFTLPERHLDPATGRPGQHVLKALLAGLQSL